MAFNAGAVVAELKLDTTEFRSGIFKANSEMAKLQKGIAQNASAIRGLGVAFAAVGVTMAAGLGIATKIAAEVEESENLFVESMDSMEKAARDWSETYSKALGLNRFETRRTLAVFNVMLNSIGLAKQEAFDMAKGMVSLTNDMASFYNLLTEDAFLKLQSGISGEIEPLRRLGISVDQVTVQTKAYAAGLAEQGATLTATQKVQARYLVILDATEKAQGDMERTLGSATNQMRVLSAQIVQTAADVGTALLPALKIVVSRLASLAKWVGDLAQRFPKLTAAVALSAAAFATMLIVLGGVAIVLPAIAAGATALGVGLTVLAVKLAAVTFGVSAVAGLLVTLAINHGTAKRAADDHIASLNTLIATAADVSRLEVLNTGLLAINKAMEEQAEKIDKTREALRLWSGEGGSAVAFVAKMNVQLEEQNAEMDRLIESHHEAVQTYRDLTTATEEAADATEKISRAFTDGDKAVIRFQANLLDNAAALKVARRLADEAARAFATLGEDASTKARTEAYEALVAAEKDELGVLAKIAKATADAEKAAKRAVTERMRLVEQGAAQIKRAQNQLALLATGGGAEGQRETARQTAQATIDAARGTTEQVGEIIRLAERKLATDLLNIRTAADATAAERRIAANAELYNQLGAQAEGFRVFNTRMIEARGEELIEAGANEINVDRWVRQQKARLAEETQKELSDLAKAAITVGRQIAGAFESAVSDGIMGLIEGTRTLGEVFADLGRSVLRILSDMIAKMLVFKALQTVGSFGGPVGGFATSILGGVGGGILGKTAGVFPLQESDAGPVKGKSAEREPVIEIHNFVTPEAVARAMAMRPGKSVILNVIGADADKNGPTRRRARR